MLVTMEERLNQMNAVLQAMQKTLECNICLDLMNKPLTTKCGHSFCSDCIQQVVKNTRNNAQCPLCMCSVTRRSLGQNNKITNLVTAVRNIISSIKRDCCFEVTPSKYRPKRRPVIACEEDDSENEENDEPRRGTRKRGVTTHYIPEVHVPKPRSKSAKQRILASNGDQELNLCMDGGTEKSTLDHLNLSSSKSNSDVLHSVIREHSYSSPTKQEPQERISARAGAQVSKGRGRLSTRGKAGSYSRKSAKTVPPKSLPTSVQHDDHVEEAKQISFVSQEEQDNIFFRERTSNNVIAEPSEHLNEKLRCEKSSDKVAKWLDTSREMGFRIGLKHSSDSTVSSSGTEPSQGLQSTKRNSINNPNSTLQASVGSAVTDEKFDNNPKSLKRTVTSSAANGSRQSSNHLETAKFFKSKMKTNLSNAEKDVAVDISTVPYKSSSQGGGSPGDPYKFIPSQKTPKPKKTVAKRGRGTKTGVRERSKSIFGKVKGRGRGCSSSSNSVFRRDSSFNYGLGNRSRMPQTQSTPSIKGRSHVPDIDLSIVKAVDISHQSLCGHVESTIVHSHDDVDDDYDIPDSCPVNTKDEFDDFVGNVKEKVIAVDCEEKTNNDPEEDKEANLLFVTPAQGPDSAGPEEKEIEGLDTLNCKKVTVGKAKGVPKNKDTRLRKGSCSSLESSSSSTKSTKHQHKSKAVKAREEVEEICSMFEEVDGHELSIITTKEDEKQKRNMEMTKANSMRQNISVLNQTADNTQLNKTIGSVEITENSMPPPRVPVRNKRVKFNANLLQNHVDCNMSGKNAMSQKQRSGNRVLLRDNVRYGSDMKRKILDPGKVIPVSVCVRDTKSPGWSHVIGARKDLKTRHTSLNITGGEHKSVCDVRTESGTNGYSSQVPMSTSETNVTIEDKSQDFDVESLNCSQSKTELVKKLKEIVTQLKTMAGNGSKNPDMGEEVLQEQDNSETKETVLGKDVQVKSGEVKHPQLASEENAVTVIHPSETEAFDNIENYVKELVLEPQAKKRKAKNLTDVDEDNISSKASKLARKKGQRENSSEIHHQVKPNSYQSAENPEDIANHMEKGEISPEKSVSASNSLSSSLQSKKASRKTYNLECNKKRNLENTETSKTVDISKVTEEQKEKIKSNISSAVISSNFGHNGAEGSELSVASVTQIHEENSSELHRNSVSEASHISCTPSQSVVVESPSAEHPERRDQPLYIISHNFNDGNIQPPYIVNHDLSDGNSQSHQVISRDISSGQVLASSTTGISHKKSKLIPFKAMGSLCTSKCADATIDAQNIPVGSSLGQDLCLHSIPCEVYQVLLKHIALLISQKNLHSSCCINITKSEERLTQMVKEEALNNTENSDTDKSMKPSSLSKIQLMPSEEECSEITEMQIFNKTAILKEFSGGNEYTETNNSEIPNSCDTQELEMALPLPLTSSLRSRSEKDNVDVGSVNRPCLRNSKRRKNVAKDAKRKTGNDSSCEEKPKQCDLQSIESSASKKIDSSSELLCSTVNSSSCQKDRYNTVTRHTDATAVDTASSKKSDILLESFSSVDTESMSCSNNNEESQQSESLLSSVKISDTKQSTPSYGSNSVATINKVAKITGISPRREKPPQSFPKLRERNVGMATRSAVSAERGVDTEKENFKNRKALPSSLTRSNRKPLQSGQTDMENIMSVVNNGYPDTVDEKLEATQLYTQTSKQRVQISDNNKLGVPVKSGDCDCDYQINGNSIVHRESMNNRVNLDVDDNGSPLKELEISGQRNYKRIRKMPSSSSSEDSDSEIFPTKRKRKPKVISSSSSSMSSKSILKKVAAIENKFSTEQKQQYQLDSEEMRDLERFDQNVWEYFSIPEKLIGEKAVEPALSKEISAQNDKDEIEANTSDEEIPSTQDVIRNVEEDMDLVRRLRQKSEHSQGVIDLVSQSSFPGRFSNEPVSSIGNKNLTENMKKPIKPVSESEDILESQKSIFEDMCTSSLEKKDVSYKNVSQMSRKSDKHISPDTTSQEDPAHEKAVEQESDVDMDSVSHSSAYSTQSEAINTQKRKEVQNEVNMLKARLQELEAEMKKESVPAGSSSKSKQDNIEYEDFELPPGQAQKSQQESEDELFSSLPDFTASTEPTLPPSDISKRADCNMKLVPTMATGAFRIVCSGLISNQMNSVDKFIKKLAPVGSSLQKNWSTGITHVIVKPDENMLAQRTLKYLYGVASGVWIISFQWVSESLATNKMLPESEFEMLDTTGIAGPQRARMGFKPVFENCEFFLSPPFQEVSLDQLKDLVELSGARLVNSPGEFTLNKNFIKLIIADTTSDHDADKFLKQYQKVSVAHDWIVECIGMHAHISILSYIFGTPSPSEMESSGIPAALLEESQELSCS